MPELTPHQGRALNIGSSISLTANAGSGKTFVLAQRYLNIILFTETPLSQIAAITFTEKAAGELFTRISNELNRQSKSSADNNFKRRIENIRKQLVSAKISTIHSFCIDLLKEFPVEASLDANFIPISEQKSNELINLSIEGSLREILNNSEEQSDVKLLVRLLGSKSTLVKQLAELIKKRKNVLSLINELYSGGVSEIAKHFFSRFQSGFSEIFEKDIPIVLSDIRIINNKVLNIKTTNALALEIEKDLAEFINNTNSNDILQKLIMLRDKILTKHGKVRKISYLSSTNREEVQKSIDRVEIFFKFLNEIVYNKNHESVERELARYGLVLISVFKRVLRTFESKKSDLGVLDFEDILIKTKELLNVKSIKEALAGKYKYLLVDEYQDTNEIQYEIFMPLLEDLRKGNLFIVGDEKQSIYRFRDADLQVFNKTKSDIQKLYGEDSLLTLPDSFRMSPAVCFFVNSLFNELFKESRSLYNEVTPSNLVCARTDKFFGGIEFLITDGEEQNEAELVSRRIIQLKINNSDRIKKWSDIAVLVRKRVTFLELQKEFIKNHIPFVIVGGTGFYQQQSISDIYNYFAFLLNQKDDAALIGTLRSPFFNISDANILALSSFDGDSYWEKLKSASNAENLEWLKTCRVLEENKMLSCRDNISVLLRKILTESSFISTISSRINGIQEVSNINKLIALTNEFFVEEFNTLYDYVSFLKNSIEKTEDEAQAGIETGSDGVNILTIHQAKGLEFPAIFLYKCDDYTPVNKVKSRHFIVDTNYGLLTKVPLNDNYFGVYGSAPIVGLYNLVESKKDIAELKRLLYVGMTRARDFLFISLTDDGKSFKQNSFAGLISEGLNTDYASEIIFLEGALTFLKRENEVFSNSTEKITLKIQIIRNVNGTEILNEQRRYNGVNENLLLSNIIDNSSEEVISATRFSTFSECPLKYKLTYNYKVNDLVIHSLILKSYQKNYLKEDYNMNELSSYLLDDDFKQDEYSKVKGKLIHYILSKNIKKEDLAAFLKSQIKFRFNEGNHSSFENTILKNIRMFYDSAEFQYINSFPVCKNEFEVYLKLEDFYLFGILDKLVIDNNKLIIIDYKTDDIKKNEIEARAKKYLPQLEFYSYIISRLYNKKQDIEGRIIFIEYPDSPFIFSYNKISNVNIESRIKIMINSVRYDHYSANVKSCKDCIFTDDVSQCIQSPVETNFN